MSAIAGLNTVQGPLALNTISGEPYADFGTLNTNSSMLFMNALGQQMANARGTASAGQRQALAQACEIESVRRGRPVERVGQRAGRSRQRYWATPMPARSPTTSAARPSASTIDSIRASWSASASATPMARSG